jgi:hypothetical protein
MVENRNKVVNDEVVKIKRKIKWAFICFFSAWILLVATLILGSLENSGLKGFMQNFGVWFTLFSFLLFAISIVLMFTVLGYLRKRKREAKMQMAQTA